MELLELASGRLSRARVQAIEAEGTVLVSFSGQEPLRCDRLCTSDRDELTLREGDLVLVLLPAGGDERGVVLGRIGPRIAARPEAPDELVIEARKNLTIRCGEGSITFREDGKILIKGRDLVSRAQRNIRLKGGSVALN